MSVKANFVYFHNQEVGNLLFFMRGELHEIYVIDDPGGVGWLCQCQTGKRA
jgi:hypothetical protein